MKRRSVADYDKSNRDAEARAVMRAEFRDYLKANGLDKTEDNAHIFAFGKTLDYNSRVNLVHLLMTGIG